MSQDQFDLFKNLLEDYHQRIEKSHMAQVEVTSKAWGEIKQDLRDIKIDVRKNSAGIANLAKVVAVFKEKHKSYDGWLKGAKTIVTTGIIGVGAWIWQHLTK